jgi:hypothetical protein
VLPTVLLMQAQRVMLQAVQVTQQERVPLKALLVQMQRVSHRWRSAANDATDDACGSEGACAIGGNPDAGAAHDATVCACGT